jgi:hypothetical protein
MIVWGTNDDKNSSVSIVEVVFVVVSPPNKRGPSVLKTFYIKSFSRNAGFIHSMLGQPPIERSDTSIGNIDA